MDFGEKIAFLNSKINSFELELENLKKRMKDLVEESKSDSSLDSVKAELRRELNNCANNLIACKKERDALIDKAVNFSQISARDLVWLLRQHKIYCRTLNRCGETWIVPINYTLLNEEMLSEEELYRLSNIHGDFLLTVQNNPHRNEKDYVPDSDVSHELLIMPNNMLTVKYNLYFKVPKTAQEINEEVNEARSKANVERETQKGFMPSILGMFKKQNASNPEDSSMRDINIDYDKFVLLNPEPLVLRDAVKLGRRLEKKGELYYKVASKEVELNSYLLDLASILPVGSNGGITIYKINADGTDVELNGELLRICNYELLGELDKIARMRFEMGMIPIQRVYEQMPTWRSKNSGVAQTSYYDYEQDSDLDITGIKDPNFEVISISDPRTANSAYVKCFIRNYEEILKSNPEVSALEAWTFFYDEVKRPENIQFEYAPISKSVFSLFSDSALEFMDYYIRAKEIDSKLTYKSAREQYMKAQKAQVLSRTRKKVQTRNVGFIEDPSVHDKRKYKRLSDRKDFNNI